MGDRLGILSSLSFVAGHIIFVGKRNLLENYPRSRVRGEVTQPRLFDYGACDPL